MARLISSGQGNARSLKAFLETLKHHGHLLHHHEWVKGHHLLPTLRVLEGAVHAGAAVSELANRLRVDVQTLVAVSALREKFAFFTWV
jgi:hypothetical protein